MILRIRVVIIPSYFVLGHGRLDMMVRRLCEFIVSKVAAILGGALTTYRRYHVPARA
jgi:hypothetical protein